MKKNWFEEKIKKFNSIGGYQKPELVEDSVKLDSNENYVIPKQFQNDIISLAKKNSIEEAVKLLYNEKDHQINFVEKSVKIKKFYY